MNIIRREGSEFASKARVRDLLRLQVAVPFLSLNSRLRKAELVRAPRLAMAVLVLCAWAAWPALSSAQQQQGNVLLDANEQLFCVLAAINAAGYDAGAESAMGNSTRTEVRAYLARQKIPVLPELRRFYANHQLSDSSSDLGQYVSLSLLIGPPPNFSTTIPVK